MGNINICIGGGSSVTSDDATASKDKLLTGCTALTSDSNDELIGGTMPNNGAQNAALNCGQSKVIPAGYTSGGTVTANSLASQTGGATADTAKVLSGYTFWRDGAKHTGILSVTSVVSFKVAQYSNLTLIASWAKPSKGPWSGLRVLCKQGSYPSNVNDGTLFYEGSGTSAAKSLAAGTWYFRAWNYMTASTGRMYGNYADKVVSNNQVKGQQAITTSSVFTVPANVYTIQTFVVGGGGSGGNWSNRYPFDAGGGGGGYTNTGTFNVTPGQPVAITIGAGGNLSNGGTTSISGFISASGGYTGYVIGGGNGGSGGAAGGINRFAGGTDGGNGGGRGSTLVGGTGQGRTTRAFGESSNTLYAGGGGGGAATNGGSIHIGGAGGAGGGGTGAYAQNGPGWAAATSGGAGTGGGGGGGCYGEITDDTRYYWTAPHAPGGSGIAIIRWGY